MLTFAFGFHQEDSDVKSSERLLKGAKKQLIEKVCEQLDSLSVEDAKDFFNNKILKKLFFTQEEHQGLLLNPRGFIVFQIIEQLQKFFEKKQEQNWPTLSMKLKPDKRIRKVQEMWGIIADGMMSQTLWQRVKMKLVLQDEQANTVTKDWGKVYRTDQNIYDNTRFKTRIEANDEEDLEVYVETNNTEQTVQVRREDSDDYLFANAARCEVMSKNSIIIPSGSSATIEVTPSKPKVLYSGTLQFKNKLASKDWKQLMDSSVLPDPVLIRGNRESVMFICKDESIYGMGKGLFGVEDKGWLRKIPTPPDCKDFAVDEHTGQIKALHGQGFRLVLTKSGKLFVNG